jgi:hypothetical protein
LLTNCFKLLEAKREITGGNRRNYWRLKGKLLEVKGEITGG